MRISVLSQFRHAPEFQYSSLHPRPHRQSYARLAPHPAIFSSDTMSPDSPSSIIPDLACYRHPSSKNNSRAARIKGKFSTHLISQSSTDQKAKRRKTNHQGTEKSKNTKVLSRPRADRGIPALFADAPRSAPSSVGPASCRSFLSCRGEWHSPMGDRRSPLPRPASCRSSSGNGNPTTKAPRL